MDILVKISRIIALIFVTVSVIIFIYTIFSRLRFDDTVSIIDSIDNTYNTISMYSGLYQFTFIVAAFWATTQQLQISLQGNKETLAQIKSTQADIKYKREKEITDDTLKHCIYYQTDLQVAFKELVESFESGLTIIEWNGSETFTRDMIVKNHKALYSTFKEKKNRNEILLTLKRFEAFSSYFIHGNMDKNLGIRIIGTSYCKQAGLLLGLISFFRDNDESEFGLSTIKLYREWKAALEKSGENNELQVK